MCGFSPSLNEVALVQPLLANLHGRGMLLRQTLLFGIFAISTKFALYLHCKLRLACLLPVIIFSFLLPIPSQLAFFVLTEGLFILREFILFPE